MEDQTVFDILVQKKDRKNISMSLVISAEFGDYGRFYF